ncbi:carbohydrate ABC transporter permease [Paenibacillus sp. PAMC21692]|uniref:carbohydrate ABC transporter permease n=1 Tax=Paenibacillus sp. PAMC21692 TaxID=2762320 RepID=UPI00164D223E|nr:carbohydrate ABC transporter permease [Paenibacillus sp. PAMC21692]QNK56155.1 carbohydrate ABC transporter permease [Paenibacillus sp. PAMC21692]
MVTKCLRSLNGLILILCAAATTFPLLNVLATSFSGSTAILSGEVFLWPVDWTMTAFSNLFKDGQLMNAMKNTVIITVAGTIMQMTATTLAAYSLSKTRLKGRRIALLLILFTMMFGSGLIPMFLLLKNLHILNTFWAIWLPGLISAYNLFVMKSSFEGLPGELEESATIDGASDLTIFTRIVIPLSKPVLAAISLFYAVGLWNVYAPALYFITDSSLMPLTVKLYQMIQLPDSNLLDSSDLSFVPPEGMKAAAIIITVLPILCLYPFLQKYFVKGVLLGSIKG